MSEKIGEFLVRIQAMTPDQVDEVLEAQKAGDKQRFGGIAIELGFIRSNAIKSYVDFLERQTRQNDPRSRSRPSAIEMMKL